MRRIPGWAGWVGLAGYVIAWDLHPDTETLSHSFAPEGTHGRKVGVLLSAYVVLHLLRLIPEQVDPLRNIPSINRKEPRR